MADVKQVSSQESPVEAPEAPTPRPGEADLDAGAKVGQGLPTEPLTASAATGESKRPLPTEPTWVQFAPALERVCRIAAWITPREPAPISYTALIIALLRADDPVSKWFQDYVGRHPAIDRRAIFASKHVAVETSASEQAWWASLLSSVARGELPEADPLYSRSARNLFDQAARIASEVSRGKRVRPVVDTRHLMAAYVFRNPIDHLDQVRGWKVDPEDWRREFSAYAATIGPTHDEDWSRLGPHPVGSGAPVIGSITADDPLAPPRDLLGVEDEAAAFARLVAAESLRPPLAIGVFGEWGSGKTFFMRRIHEGVRALSRTAATRAEARKDVGPFLPDIVQIRFNAWHYIETNLWASLVEYIFTELDRWLQNKSRGSQNGAEQVFNRLATAQQLKLDALDDVVTRRAERRAAEERAERARRQYEQAAARASAVGAGAYARALVETLLNSPELKADLQRAGDALGVPSLETSSSRVLETLSQARTAAGRAQLMMHAGIARLGRGPWLAAVALALVAAPLLAVALRDALAALLAWDSLKDVQESVLALSGALTGAAAWGGALVRKANAALAEIDEFDQKLRRQVEAQVAASVSGPEATRTAEAEDELRKRKQSLEAAEQALADAEARLNQARSDFEGASARSRLNAFIRAKATDGDYGKHLGIIAAIRRDFGQLAALMGAADNVDEQRLESERLAAETAAAVQRFCERLAREPEVRLTAAEVRSLLALLEPAQVGQFLDQNGRRQQFVGWLDGDAEALRTIESGLAQVKTAPVHRFSRIILYIDDLDRCPPKVVVDVLQAVHLLLCFPLFTVLVAVDARWVSRAIHEQFPMLLGETAPFTGGPTLMGAGATSHDYLEKIFQIPYWVRPVGTMDAQRYVSTLVEPDVQRVSGVAAIDSVTAGGESTDGAKPRAPRPAGERIAPSPAPDAGGAALPAPTAAAVGLELTRWEADALERFAPLISATPRRLIRFVNLYRLLKTAMASEERDRLVGERGESDTYRALIVQLAIVTGAPNAAPAYFKCLAGMEGQDALLAVLTQLRNDPAFKDGRDHEIVLRVLQSAQEWPGARLKVDDLLATAPTARRYSFTAWSQ